MYARRLIFALLFTGLFFTISVKAQPAFTAEDLAFFQKKAGNYQRWLDKTGLGTALRVTNVRFKKNNNAELELRLHVNATNLDTAIGLWNRAQKDYLRLRGRPLEADLFHTFTAFMEIPPEQGNVQVYVLDPAGEQIRCFYVGIWAVNSEIKTDNHVGDCRDKPLNLSLQPLPLKKIVRGKTVITPKKLTSEQVFDGILAFLNEKYGPSKCYDRYPEIAVEARTENYLRVSISDLCQVVLREEENSLWCKSMELLGWRCNDKRRERLEFEFNYASGTNSLSGRITGKFGSGVYKPRTSGYMDMEPDFDDELNRFHLRFQQELKTYLDRL